MGCPSYVELEDTLVFSITSHDPDTGVLTDADSAPTYRIYEDETATPILNDVMAKLDDANTTGFYTESITCSAANGFEDGKTYTIYIEATVDSDTGGITYGFKATTTSTLLAAIKAKTDNQPAGIPKNVALSNFKFLMLLSSDGETPATGVSGTITAEIQKDAGAFATCTNSAIEVSNGVYRIDLIQAEMNADIICLKFTEATCLQRTIVLKTST